jgi:hypothetical protein
MLGVIVNTMTVIIGSMLGMLLKKNIPENITGAVMKGLGLCTLYIGWTGSLKGENTLILIISMAIGIAVGQALDLDGKLNRFAEGIERRFKKAGQNTSFAEGFITASLVFCVGAMTIVGSLQAGLQGNNEMLFTKATLDFISSLIFAAALGVGVLGAAAFVFVFQGSIVMLAGLAAPFLNDRVIAEMTCAGSLLIFAIGLNLLGITKLKVMNYLPAIFIPIILCLFM